MKSKEMTISDLAFMPAWLENQNLRLASLQTRETLQLVNLNGYREHLRFQQARAKELKMKSWNDIQRESLDILRIYASGGVPWANGYRGLQQ